MSGGAFSGLRMVELGGGIAASYCTKLLADYGADVIKVEPPTGDPVRRYGPFPGDQPDPEKSGLFLHLNTNKQGISLDLDDRSLDRLTVWADAIVESGKPGCLDYERLKAVNPKLVLTSITPFGQDGPYRDWHVTEMVLFAMCGRMFGHGHQQREPLRYAPGLMWFQAGTTAAAATAGALWGAHRTGKGAWIDLSIQEALAGNVDSRLVMASYSGTSGGRTYRVHEYPRGAYPCKDGFVLFGSGADRYFRRLCQAFGRPDLLDDPRWAAPQVRPEHRDEWEAIFLDWLVDRTRTEVFEVCQSHGVLCAPVWTAEEVLNDPQNESRGFFRQIGDWRFPGPPFLLQRGGWQVRSPAPSLGQDNEWARREILGGAGGSLSPVEGKGGLMRSNGPLTGIRAIDFSEVWAGPMGTSILADLGADVVKVESYPRAPQTRPVYPPVGSYGYAPGDDRPWDRYATHNMANRNKQGIALNAREEEGRRIFQALASVSDILVDGYSAGAIDRLGLGYEVLRKANPGLIMVSMPGWGNTGPYAGYVSLGSTVDATAGHHYLRSYPDADPSQSPACVHSDAIAAVTLVFAIMAALFERERTGEGQWIDFSQAEAFLPHIASPLLDFQMNGRVAQPLGNHDRTMAPHSCYPCEGEDEWIVITVETERQWRALCEVSEEEEWMIDSRFATRADRLRNQQALDDLVAGWTAEHEKHALARRLQAAGVPAAPVLKEMEVIADPHLAARGFFQTLDHPVIGPRVYPGHLWRQTGLDSRIRSGPNALGEHNAGVLHSLLGYAGTEIDRLKDGGAIGDTYGPDSGK